MGQKYCFFPLTLDIAASVQLKGQFSAKCFELPYRPDGMTSFFNYLLLTFAPYLSEETYT
jgi:hypothetical protein